MIGPRSPIVHPHRRLGRRLLPLLIVMTLGPLACTSDQTTGPTSAPSESPFVAATGPHPRARNEAARLAAAARIARASTRVSTTRSSFSVSSTGPSVLLLSDVDANTTTALADTLTAAGFQVTVRPAPEYSWDGTNPSLTGFGAVVHLDGGTYDLPLPSAGQTALTAFVQNGGGYVGAQWGGYETLNQPDLADLVLLGVGNFDPNGPEQNCASCDVTYLVESGQEGHPVLAGLPSSFVFHADAQNAGPAYSFSSEPSTVLMHVPNGGPAVIVRSFGSGKVVNFSFAPNYPYNDQGDFTVPATLLDSNIKHLYVNAVRWAATQANGTQPAAQTIDFAALSDKIYGNPDFTVSATTSSGLPVSFTADGPCTIVGSQVSIIGVGSCTITAHQAGNEDYLPAADVSHSFNIAKATATISLAIPSSVYDGSPKSATASTNPAGLSGLTVAYSQGGSSVTPLNAGSYQVTATLNNANYEASPASGTLTIQQADPTIQWSPASLSTGTPLGPSQLNARAMGVGGASVSGSFNYNPTAGTSFDNAGTVSLSTQFTSSNANYRGGSKTVTISVSGAMNFTGFFLPVRNQPYVNAAIAGSAIPIKFTIGGYRGLRVLQTEPSSVQVACPAGAPQSLVVPRLTRSNGLHSVGYSYTYVWKTSASWGGTCRKFVLTLADGSTHEATFRFLGGRNIFKHR